MNTIHDTEYNYWAKKLFKNVVFKGGSAPAPDYAAINRAQEQRRMQAQAVRDEQFRVEGISDYIDYMYENPEQEKRRSATGQFFNAISPGKTPNQFLASYRDNKSITLKDVKKDSGKFFDNRTAQASVKEGRIKLGKRADKPNSTGLLGTADSEQKQLLGA
jgi:hypothetical protein